MDLATLNAKQTSLVVEFNDEVINLQILPLKLTPAYRAKLQKLSRAQDKEDARDADAELVADLVESWDVVNNGEPFPPTYENLRLVPLALLACIATEILEHVGKLAAPKPRKN